VPVYMCLRDGRVVVYRNCRQNSTILVKDGRVFRFDIDHLIAVPELQKPDTVYVCDVSTQASLMPSLFLLLRRSGAVGWTFTTTTAATLPTFHLIPHKKSSKCETAVLAARQHFLMRGLHNGYGSGAAFLGTSLPKWSRDIRRN
jgi:hypothetical protein